MSDNEKKLQFQMDLLRAEVNRTQNRIQSYDNLIFKIKGWCITLWIGAIGLSINQDNPDIILMSIPILISFWLLEANQMKYKYRHIMRMRSLEKFINGTGEDGEPCLLRSIDEEAISDFPITDPVGLISFSTNEKFRNEYIQGYRLSAMFLKRGVKIWYLLFLSLTLSLFLIFFISKSY